MYKQATDRDNDDYIRKMNRVCLRIKSRKECEGEDNNGMYVCVCMRG